MCLSLSSPFPLFPQPQVDLLSPCEFPYVFVQLCCQFSSPPVLFRELIYSHFSMSARVNCFDFLNIATVNIR